MLVHFVSNLLSRDLADLRGALGAERVTPATRPRWATDYRYLERELRGVLTEVRKYRVRLGPQRVKRMEDPDAPWLRGSFVAWSRSSDPKSASRSSRWLTPDAPARQGA